MATLFSQIDTAGTGSITQSQFNQAFQSTNPPAGFRAMGASAVFQSLNPSSSGTVSQQNFVQGMTQLMAQVRSGNASGS
ncbi:MAG: EF-hand domain-containing protein [Beijerinckiaceae bacterium]|jgi:Ca2+-binding EF-hand superfamily protein